MPARHRSRSGEFPNSGTRKQAGLRISACPGATAIHKGLPYVGLARQTYGGQEFIPCFWGLGQGENLRPNLILVSILA